YEEHALVEVELKTGRTHQIRVHLSHRGHPLLGDDLYGGKRSLPAALGPGPDELDLAKPVVDRQALHATHLRIHHPISGDPMSFAASPPEDLCGAVRRLRRGRCTTLSPAGAELSGSLFD
ncbi:MAG: pseudouridine synthase, partial [Planctomycetota bacterium]|nr:pseudouridine synthase [Planctomycetota bacterium]